jgi:hypothetical protein
MHYIANYKTHLTSYLKHRWQNEQNKKISLNENKDYANKKLAYSNYVHLRLWSVI